jgi:hypothetical protein
VQYNGNPIKHINRVGEDPWEHRDVVQWHSNTLDALQRGLDLNLSDFPWGIGEGRKGGLGRLGGSNWEGYRRSRWQAVTCHGMLY